MPEPIKGVETPQGTPSPAAAPAQGAGTPAPQAGASAKPAEQGQKVVPISALHEERDKRQATEAKYQELQAEINNMKSMLGQYQQPQQFQQPYQQPVAPFTPYQQAPQSVKEQIDNLWQEDIRKGFQAEMMAMMQYRDWVDTKVDTEVETLRSKAADFGQYEGKVRQYIRSLPMDAKAQPNIVQAAYLMVRGQDADNQWKQREAELMKKYQGGVGATGLTGTFGAPQPANEQPLTQDELLIAQQYGMTPEEYAKNKAGY